MDQNDTLSEQFEASRGHLRAVAYRMLGSTGEAEDAVQEAWLRMARADRRDVANLTGWLTTVVARVCLDMLRSRKSRGETSIAGDAETLASDDDPGRETELADSVGMAMQVVLQTLGPAERVAFVLHDLFNLPFETIGPVVRRSPAAARQLASRARRRIQGAPLTPDAERARQREVVAAFQTASRDGDFSALLSLLDPDVVLRADAPAVEASAARVSYGAPALAPEIHGAHAVAEVFKGRAAAARLALVDDEFGLAYAPGGQPRVVFDFVIDQGRIVEISLIADPDSVSRREVRFGV